MTDKEISRFMELFQIYRTHDRLEREEHQEFEKLAEKWRKLKGETEPEGETTR